MSFITKAYMTDLEKKADDTDPALRVGVSTSTVAVFVSIIVLFFPHLDAEYINLILAVAAVLLPLISSVFIRNRVWSPASVWKVLNIVEEVARINETKRLRGGQLPREEVVEHFYSN